MQAANPVSISNQLQLLQNSRSSIIASLREGDHQAATRAAPWLLGTTQSKPNIDSSWVARSVLTACQTQHTCFEYWYARRTIALAQGGMHSS